MSTMKNEFIEHKISTDSVEAGINHLMMWGKKTFKDHTGEWVEVRCSRMSNFFDSEFEVYPHLTMETS